MNTSNSLSNATKSGQFMQKINFFPSPCSLRVLGLIHTLSAKFAQDDVKFVQNLEIPSDKPEYIEDLIGKPNF